MSLPVLIVNPPRLRLRQRLAQGWHWLTSQIAKRAGRNRTASRFGASTLLTPMAFVVCGTLLFQQITPQTLDDLRTAFMSFTPLQWGASLVFVWLSFLAIGRNEAVAHDLVGTGVAHKRARWAGAQAVALAQSVGFSALTAAFARKRAMPELELWSLARLSVAASLAFWVAFGVLTVQVLLAQQTNAPWLPISAACVTFVLARLLRPTSALPGLTRWRMLRTVLWTNLDLLCAAGALFVFLPAGHDVSLITVFCAYLIALGAGLLSQSPGGLGAFELTLIITLPQIPDGQLLAAIVAYRATYHTLPALIAAALLLRGPRRADPAALVPVPVKAMGRTIIRSGQADWGLARQDADILLTRDHASGWLVGQTMTALTAIGRPLGLPALQELSQQAQITGHSPFLYKCDARTAAIARKHGWQVKALSREAVISPAAWSPEGPERRQLRRKLRQATKAGLEIDIQPKPLPLDAMAVISALWKAERGGERGFSMGRFHPALVTNQIVIFGRIGPKPVGFVTFHRSRGEWGLDLMRLLPDAPPGTMQALITAAISLARQRGVARLSLAACLNSDIKLPGRLDPGDNAQFKQSFAPRWKPLYVAAPNRRALVSGLISTTIAIHHPGPIRTDVTHPRPWPRRGGKPDAKRRKFRIEFTPPPWHSRPQNRPNANAATASGPRGSHPNDERPDKTP